MRSKRDLIGGLVLAVVMLTACAPTATDATTTEKASGAEAMAMGETPTAESMMMTEAPTAASMMMHETPSAESMGPTQVPSMKMADWLGTPLVDATTSAPFKISDYHGKVVLVETMAVWCTNCRAQQEEIRGLESQMMEQTNDLVVVSLDIDPNEDQATLKKYAQATGFQWTFAVAPPELVRTIGNTYGDQFLNPYGESLGAERLDVLLCRQLPPRLDLGAVRAHPIAGLEEPQRFDHPPPVERKCLGQFRPIEKRRVERERATWAKGFVNLMQHEPLVFDVVDAITEDDRVHLGSDES